MALAEVHPSAFFFTRQQHTTDCIHPGFPNSIIYKATNHEVYMIFYRNEAKNRLLSFTAVFQVSETTVDYAVLLIGDIVSNFPLDSYNQEEQLAISEMFNRSSAIGRVITIIPAEKTPTKAIDYVYDKIQEAALQMQLNVHVTVISRKN